ncbi:uncharacterized protein F4822DRAFT_435046 [Hypoxylon trugodes]|uniref:uncharacterized protein n=1 Tax=Hypoxylon trugodes TaxID=326681 RepID=UPI00219AB4B8|nr:uncharacterized protein F4822DRAFT_435046 [Hypoxylon trugodes]KAI1383114.1 hypothetical protein F4822DRAFT_435046 [Hypoxylon trugodes]
MDNMNYTQPGFAPVYNYPNPIHYMNNQYRVQHNFNYPYMYSYQSPRAHLLERNGAADPRTESKPRLSKEEVEKLEKVFQENPKPSSSVKAALADSLGLERPRINNWFQNRRAKAKQDKKQSDYNEQLKAEKASASPSSPEEGGSSGSSEPAGDGVRRHTQPSSATFPDMNSASEVANGGADDEVPDDDEPDCDGSDSPFGHEGSGHVDVSEDCQQPYHFDNTPIILHDQHSSNFSHSDVAGFNPINAEHLDQDQLAGLTNSIPSPNDQFTGEQTSCQYSMIDGNFSTPIFRSESTFSTTQLNGTPLETHGSGSISEEGTMIQQGIPTPTDSFKSPPPPANIASRRNIPRPATLQTNTAHRSRSYNFGAYRNTLDGSKRVGPSSPAPAAVRRISSTACMSGRIQKPGSGSRSPMYRCNPETIRGCHVHSPAGAVTATFPGAAPPTPMTPAVIDSQVIQDPTMSSHCSDDTSFMLANVYHEAKADANLKTPPSTPGVLNAFGHSFNTQPFNNNFDFQSMDQPILTPYQTEFPDLTVRNVPSYVETNEVSPTTPLYPVMMGLPEQNSYVHNPMGNTQFDWDANESVNSSRSPQNQHRTKQIQFTQNLTPLDYPLHQDK